MPAVEYPLSSSEKEILRQRDIEAQMSALHALAPNTRAAAARRLGDLQAGIDALIDALHDPAESVRASAAMALGSFVNHERSPEIIDHLLAAIDDPIEKVCQSAIRSLGMLQAVSARPDLEEFLDDANPFILGAAILALARLHAVDLAEKFTNYLHHESPYVKMQAARAVGFIKYQAAGPLIIRLLENTRAARASEGFSDPAAHFTRHEEDLFGLQNQLIRVAGELKLTTAVPILIDIAQKDIGFRGLAVESLIAIGADVDPQLLTSLLNDPGIYLRRRLLQLISQYNYRPALPQIRALLEEDNVSIRIAALQAITQMRDISALPRITWMCYHENNPFIRVQAVQALADFSGQDAVPHLLALASDPNFQVRRTTVAYLLDWGLNGHSALIALARFAKEFPTDELVPEIEKLLQNQSIVLHEPEPLIEKPVQVLVPPEVSAQIGEIRAALERWYQSLHESETTDHRAVQAALAYLLDVLRSA